MAPPAQLRRHDAYTPPPPCTQPDADRFPRCDCLACRDLSHHAGVCAGSTAFSHENHIFSHFCPPSDIARLEEEPGLGSEDCAFQPGSHFRSLNVPHRLKDAQALLTKPACFEGVSLR